MRAPLPADQPVEGHHQSEGTARDAKEDDAKEYALHALITLLVLAITESTQEADCDGRQ